MDKISELLTRRVANIIPGKSELEKVLHTDKKLNVYFGIDPTATQIHLGHAVALRNLRSLVELGHHVTFLIGDFTALIGDTSDKDSERPVLTYDQIEANFQTYKSQASKILDFSQIKIAHNSDWLKKLDFAEVIKLTRHFSLNDFISRELIKKRLTEGKSVSLPEVLYPVMQGYDSYFMDTDLQLGGTDQTFNMQAGRTLQKQLRNKESYVMSFEFLTGLDGRKMSKSWGNAIWLTDEPNDMYGKIMSLRDDLINQYFLLATNLPENSFPQDAHPMDLKKKLAWQIVSELDSSAAADAAQKFFESTVQKKEIPDNLPEFSVSNLKDLSILNILVSSNLASSNSDARRLVDQGAVKINNEKISEYNKEVHLESVLSVGSHKLIKIVA